MEGGFTTLSAVANGPLQIISAMTRAVDDSIWTTIWR